MEKKLLCDGVIFDVDGTLWDIAPVAAHVFNRTVEEYTTLTTRVAPDDLRAVYGKPYDEIGRILYPELRGKSNSDLMAIILKRQDVALRDSDLCPFPGVDEVFRTLSGKVPLFIVSNCETGYIERFLDKTGNEPFITDHLCPGDSGKLKADNIRAVVDKYGLQHPVYVGDTDGDHIACRSAGVPLVFAAYGFGQTENPDAVIHTMCELPDRLEFAGHGT